MASDIIKSLQTYVLELSAEVKALKEEIAILSSGGFMPAGSVYFADLPSLIDERYGFVYNIKDDFTTTSDFIEGAGKRYSAGTNVGIVKDDNNNLKYDALASFVDTAAIYEAIGVKQNINLSEEIAGASTVEGALKAINQSTGITVDTEISSTSTNPVQNKVIKGQLDLKLDNDGKATSAASADYAAKAERDSHNNVIFSTYATKTELSDGLSGKVNTVAGKGLSSNDYTNGDKDYVDSLPAQLLGKQDTLTFDDTPTDGSNNPVKSNGIYDSEKDIYAAIGKMGAKNLIHYPYYETTKTVNGITFTDNGDGTVTVNGTAVGTVNFIIANEFAFIENESYILTGCPSGGASDTYRQYIITYGGDTGEGKKITPTSGSGLLKQILIQIFSGTTLSNVTFKPMLRLASDTDNTYQPYAKTNKQLTDEIALKQNATDNNLQTTDKTIVGGINELKSGLANRVKRFSVGEINAQSMKDFVLGVINAISNDIGVGEIAEVYAIYPNVDYFAFTVCNFEGVNYMFRANNTSAMYYGTVNTSTSSVSLYYVTATAQ